MGQVTNFHRVTFLLLGISSLIGWNAVLNSFAYFIGKFGVERKVPFYFPIPLMIANFMWGPFVPWLSARINLFQRIFWGLSILSLILVILPIIANAQPNDVGFGLCLACTFLIGSFNSISQNSMIGMVSAVGGELISIYWVATGVSGLAMNVCQAIAYGIFGQDESAQLKGTIFYFCMACAISAVTLLCLHILIRRADLIDSNGALIQDGQQGAQALLAKETTHSVSAITDSDEKENLIIVNDMEPVKEGMFQEIARKITSGMVIARSVPVYVWFIYVETFAMFPGVITARQWKAESLEQGEKAWGNLIIITAYNIGDIVGKQITYWRQTFNYVSAVSVVWGRLLFFLLLLPMASIYHFDTPVISDDWFAVIISFLFAVTNGYSTASLMTIGPELTDDPKKKEVIGFINGFSLTFGISCGTFVALIFQNSAGWKF